MPCTVLESVFRPQPHSFLIWGNTAVGITDSAADGMYLGTAAIGIIGAIIALFRPHRGALAMFTTALWLVLVSGGALDAGMVPNDYPSAFELIGITGFYVALFVGVRCLLLAVVRERSERGAA